MPGLRLLKLVPGRIWLMAGLLGVAVYAGMQARHYAGQAAEAEARVARAEDRAAVLLEHQAWQNEQRERLSEVLAKRDEQLARDRERLELARLNAQDLERNDAETADWADQPVPDAVREWVRDLYADPSDNDPAVPGDTVAPH